MRKKICILLVATFLEDRRMNKQLQVFLWGKWGGGSIQRQVFLYICIQTVNWTLSKQFFTAHEFLTCTEYGKRLAQYYIYIQKEYTDEMPGGYDKLASAGNALCSFATCIVGYTAGLLR